MRQTIRSRPIRLLAAVALAATLAGATAGCSGDDDAGPKTAQQALDDLNVGDKPAVVIATAVERLDPRAVLGADLAGQYLRLKYALEGLSWADAQCAVDTTRQIVTPAAFDKLPLGQLDDVSYDHPELVEAARTCASPASLSRLDLATDTTSTTVAGQPLASAAPDIDGAAIGAMSKAFYRLSAASIGLTSTETDCMIDAVLGDRSDADFVALVTGAMHSSLEETAPRIVACLKGKRLDEVTPVAAKSLLAQQAAAKAERERVQAMIQKQVEANAATTLPAGG